LAKKACELLYALRPQKGETLYSGHRGFE
jgi:hypothetical protein